MSDTIIVEQKFDQSREQVWKALTDRDEMIQWYFESIPKFEANKGFKVNFLVDAGERVFDHHWTNIEVIENELLIQEWKYPPYEGSGIVHFILEDGETSSSCILTIKVDGITSFPQEIPEFTPESCEGGWKYFIQDRLKNYLNSK